MFAPSKHRPLLDVTSDPILLIGAGDPHSHFTNPSFAIGQQLKAELASNPSAYMFCAGDLVPNGKPVEYNAYNSAWGKFGGTGRFFSVIGNHDRIYDPSGKPYYDYVGDCGGPAGLGYYAVTLGAWRIYFLNSEQRRSAQTTWLAADLPLWSSYNIMAVWHTPTFDSICRHSTKPMTNGGASLPWWRLLQQYGAELVVNGHVHRYERYAKQLDDTTPSDAGIRQFTLGTGGVNNMPILAGGTHPNSLIQLLTHGYFKLWLYPDRYEWQFIDINSALLDSGVQTSRKVIV
jgi:hypothetical protein